MLRPGGGPAGWEAKRREVRGSFRMGSPGSPRGLEAAKDAAVRHPGSARAARRSPPPAWASRSRGGGCALWASTFRTRLHNRKPARVCFVLLRLLRILPGLGFGVGAAPEWWSRWNERLEPEPRALSSPPLLTLLQGDLGRGPESPLDGPGETELIRGSLFPVAGWRTPPTF